VLIDRMTYRQMDVMRLLCAGQIVAEVAATLGDKRTTVAVYRELAEHGGDGGATPAPRACHGLGSGATLIK
jgi:hypothetical protein